MATDNPDFRLIWYTWSPTEYGSVGHASGREYYVAGIKDFKLGYTATGKYNQATQRMMDLYTQGLMDGLPNQLIPLRRNEDTGVVEQRWPMARIQPK